MAKFNDLEGRLEITDGTDLGITLGTVLIANSVRNDPKGDSRGFFKPGIWTDTGQCLMQICGMDESKYEKSVKGKVKQIEGEGPVHQEALLRLIDHRICPDEYNFEEIYAMYS